MTDKARLKDLNKLIKDHARAGLIFLILDIVDEARALREKIMRDEHHER